MSQAYTTTTPVGSASLRQKVKRAERRDQTLMMGLMAPAVIFVCLFFVVPIGVFLFNSVDNPEVRPTVPRTLATMENWDGRDLPGEETFKALAQELKGVAGTPEVALLGRRLNYNISGFRSLILRTASKIEAGEVVSYKDYLISLNRKWGQVRYWKAIKRQEGRFTSFYLLSAMDLERSPDGSIVRTAPDKALFLKLFARTFWISFTVMAWCLVIGFPVAHVMASSSPKIANILFMMVLLPFWTSVLVRATAWVILLQNQGLVTQALAFLGIISEPMPLIFNRIGLYISLVHVLLPFVILPVYSVIKSIPAVHMQAAASLGAKPWTGFWRVYLPQAVPGIVAGGTLVFVISLGYYVTPALVGGPSDPMIGTFIAHFTSRTVNWGMASALGAMLLLIVAALYLVLGQLVGFERLKVR